MSGQLEVRYGARRGAAVILNLGTDGQHPIQASAHRKHERAMRVTVDRNPLQQQRSCPEETVADEGYGWGRAVTGEANCTRHKIPPILP
ncbi:hypothetical protein SKAU_G00304350 [Synaphobranchus kaupii]|uniref:Uncharacterized protein n=1 Tax=Synaphobranchus kaupii TaxID=118154 RepID=A0A9Q1IMM1_SYNKA|nr:hypothetical protein SKAU_G00304350 [Synaphobranchus kaupii]